MLIPRILELAKITEKKSLFLLGLRQTGKIVQLEKLIQIFRFILDEKFAIEVKGKPNLNQQDCKGLKALREDI